MNICTLVFIGSLLTAVQRWKQPRVPRQMNRQKVVSLYSGLPFSLKMETMPHKKMMLVLACSSMRGQEETR